MFDSRVAALFILIVAGVTSGPVLGQAYPSKPIRMIVASSPGTSSDLFARLVGQHLTELYGQQVIADNRAGAGGLIGNDIVSKAVPDGYTLALIGSTRIVSALLRKDSPYHPINDTTTIAEVASIPNALVVAPSVPAKSVKEFVAYAQTRPGQLNFASVGIGSSAHIAAEIFVRATNVKVVHVPFKVLGDVYPAMISNQVHFYVFTVPATLPMLRDGRLRALAVTTAQRTPVMPDIQTVVEAGFPAAQFENWSGIVAPPRTPKRVVEQLHRDIVKTLSNSLIKEQFLRLGAVPKVDTTPDGFMRLLKSEYTRYQEIIQAIGMQT